VFLGLSIQAWITIVVLIGLVIANALTKIPAEFLSMCALAILITGGAIGEHAALSGFASEGVVVTGVGDIIVMALLQSGFIIWIVKNLMGRPGRYLQALVRIMFPVAVTSALVDDLSTTSVFTNIVRIWSKKIKVAPSKLLIPVAYVSLMGGSLTIIGTTPNIIISSLYAEQTGEHMGFFQVTIPALFCLVVGCIAIVLMRNILPERKSADTSFKNTSNYTVELLVPTENPAVGCSVDEAGLWKVPGGTLIEIVRFDGEIISPVTADEFILGGDRLIYSGEVDEILDLRSSKGLVNADHHVYSIDEIDKGRRMRTATVKYGSSLVGRTISETDFEQRSGMTLVAVSRKGETISKSPREIEIFPGDALLLECPPKKPNTETYSKDISFFDSMSTIQPGPKTWIAVGTILAMVVLITSRALTLLQGTLLAAMFLLSTKCVTAKQARKGIGWELLILIACAIAFGKAIQQTGISAAIADGVTAISGGSAYMTLFLVCLCTMLVTAFFSNTVSAAVFFPISYQCAIASGCSPLPFAIATMLAVNASYVTPYCSPVNTAVYGPGGYEFKDFLKIGIPLSLIELAAIMTIVPLIYPLKG